MTEKTMRAEQDRERARTDGLRRGGVLWVMAGVACAGLFLVVFVGERLLLQEPGTSSLALGGAIAALLTGGLLIARPESRVVRWSTIVGLAWLLAFGSLLVIGLVSNGPDADSGPMVSLSLITALGVTAAVVTLWSARPGRGPD